MDIERAGLDFYDGSRMFERVADKFQMSVDLVNFLVVQAASLLLASILRNYLAPTKVSISIRHIYSIIFGLLLGYFCFGAQSLHITLLPALCYTILRFSRVDNVQRYILVVAMTYLSCLHLHRQLYEYGSGASLDITGPLMIITQKVTSLAYSIVDGRQNEKKTLTPTQQYHAVVELPCPLEYFSYMLNFMGLMAGPFLFYRDYIEFIEGKHISKHSVNGKNITEKSPITIEPSPYNAVVRKLLGCLICAYIYMNYLKIYPLELLKDDKFTNESSFTYKLWYITLATTIVRFKYYYAWLFGDAICNAAGLGFNGYEEDGSPKWDMISNIEILNFEFGTNFRNCINSWNIGTNHWLRMVVYERLPASKNASNFRTIFTFMISALWHGFYPGYYVTFATGALILTAARIARKIFRDHFQGSKQMKIMYDIATCLVTRVFMAYTTFPFVLLELRASLRLYIKLFMCLHLVAVVVILAGHRLSKAFAKKLHQKTSIRDQKATGVNETTAPLSTTPPPPIQQQTHKIEELKSVTNLQFSNFYNNGKPQEYNSNDSQSYNLENTDVRRRQVGITTDELINELKKQTNNITFNDLPASLSCSKYK